MKGSKKRGSYEPVAECELTKSYNNSTSSTTTKDDDDNDERIINNGNGRSGLLLLNKERPPPLPLSQPAAYWKLVGSIYQSSCAIILGNMLEWLDFGIFGYSNQEISQQLFGDHKVTGWIMFGLGYAVRPLGAYGLGQFADTISRKGSFMLSVIGMATATAGFAFIPAVCHEPHVTIPYCVSSVYQTTVLAVCCRFLQGICAGGVAGGVNVIQSELWSTRERQHAVVQSVGVNNVSGAAASMLAAGIVLGLRYYMGDVVYANYGWRLAFLVVIVPSLLSSYLTWSSMPESNDYAVHDGHLLENTTTAAAAAVDNVGPTHPRDKQNHQCLYDTISSRHYNIKTPTWLLMLVSIYIQFTIASYNNLNVYMVQYAQEHYDGISDNTATLMVLIGKAVQIGMTVPAAFLGDIKGWFWTAGLGGVLCSILAVPMMAASRLGGIGVAWILVGFLEPAVATLWILTAPLLVTSIFPVQSRSKYTSLVMATGVALAGFFPLVLDSIQNDMYVTGTVLAVLAALGALCIIWIRNQARNGRVRIYQRPELY